MKKIILISILIVFVSSTFAQKKHKARWQKERFSFGIMAYTNTPITKDDFGIGIGLNTRILKFISIETNIYSNTFEIYGVGGIRIYPIPKIYVRNINNFNIKIIPKRFYFYINGNIDTFKEMCIGIGLGININNKWTTEIHLYNKTKKQKIILNPYLGFGFYRNLNFHEYPPNLRKNGTY